MSIIIFDHIASFPHFSIRYVSVSLIALIVKMISTECNHQQHNSNDSAQDTNHSVQSRVFLFCLLLSCNEAIVEVTASKSTFSSLDTITVTADFVVSALNIAIIVS